MSMKIALFTGGYSNYPLERAFQAAAKYGYDGIELGGFRPHAYAPDLARGGAEKSSNYQEIIICRLLIMFQKILALHIA